MAMVEIHRSDESDAGLPDNATDDAIGELLPLLWMNEAACRGKTHLFFPPRAERPQARVRREALARQVCLACPVMETCRDWARDNREYGFWGGESEEERHLAGFTVAAPIGIRARQSIISS
jgi:WhiB family transcriptional regulator, redox-sensing transcriptional regulator